MDDNDKVKLRVNIIIGNKIYRKGETIDKSIIPESVRKREYYWRVEDEEKPVQPVEHEAKRLVPKKKVAVDAVTMRRLQRARER
jgi:hypothetical protein